MQRIFAKIVDYSPILDENDIHHLVNVIRLKEGEQIEIVDEERCFIFKMVSSRPFKLEFVKEIEEDRELPSKIYIGFAILKGEHNDMIIEKCTELGVSGFFPFYSERTFIQDGFSPKKVERMRNIALSSAKQSRRSVVPTVSDVKSLKELLEEEADIKIIAYERKTEDSLSLDKLVFPGKRIIVLIGPEGGYSEKEVELAISKGYRCASLGKRILRAETAAIYASCIIGNSLEK